MYLIENIVRRLESNLCLISFEIENQNSYEYLLSCIIKNIKNKKIYHLNNSNDIENLENVIFIIDLDTCDFSTTHNFSTTYIEYAINVKKYIDIVKIHCLTKNCSAIIKKTGKSKTLEFMSDILFCIKNEIIINKKHRYENILNNVNLLTIIRNEKINEIFED